jgi:hypothetical protein
MTEKIRASDVVRELVLMFGECPKTQRQMHSLILDGVIPATRGPNGRFEIDRPNLPAIGKIVGLTEPTAT